MKVIADLLPRDSHFDLFDLVEANEFFLPVLGYLVDEGWQAIYPSFLGLQLQQLHIDERLQMVALFLQPFAVALEVIGDFAVERPQLAHGDGLVSHPGQFQFSLGGRIWSCDESCLRLGGLFLLIGTASPQNGQ